MTMICPNCQSTNTHKEHGYHDVMRCASCNTPFSINPKKKIEKLELEGGQNNG